MKKKIVILSAFLSPFRSGAEACAEEVAARLKDDYDITIVTARMRRDLPYLDTLPSGVRVWRVGIGSPLDKWLYPFLAPRAVKALRPDVIHAVLETFAGLALHFCRKSAPSAKRILTCQTTNRSFLKRMIVRSPDVVTVISSALQNIVRDAGRTDTVLIPNGVVLRELREAAAAHPPIDGRILFAGRLEQMKGVDILLTAFAELTVKNEKLKMLQLRIVGDGSLRRSLEAQATELGLADRVTFTGYLPPQRIAAEFAQASIFCGLSRSEALGNVFLEAQAAGCAVVATNVGGIPDIVTDGVTGLLVPPDDASAAAAALDRLLRDDALRGALSEAGRQHAQGYDWDVIAGEYARVYGGEMNNE